MESYVNILGESHRQTFFVRLHPKFFSWDLGPYYFGMLPTYTSHEVYIDDKQIDWFEEVARIHPAADGWKVFEFSHAPPMVMEYGTLQRDLQHFKRLCFIREVDGLRVLQENHVINRCCFAESLRW